MKTTIEFGKIAYESNREVNAVTVNIELKIKEKAINWETLETVYNVPEFTASAAVWNSKHTDYVMGGQCLDDLKDYQLGGSYDNICRIWKQYHLNDCKAGTKAQTEAIDVWKEEGNKYEYSAACNYLKSIGLYEDRGYKYGSGWLYMPIPENVIEEITNIINPVTKETQTAIA